MSTVLAPLVVSITGGTLSHGLGTRPQSPIYPTDLIRLICQRVECEKRITFAAGKEMLFAAKLRKEVSK